MPSRSLTAHPCNMKEFELYVGMTGDHLTKVLEGSLKNDTLPETFPIEHANTDGVCFPVRFVKIVPLSCVTLIPISILANTRKTLQSTWLEFLYIYLVCVLERDFNRSNRRASPYTVR